MVRVLDQGGAVERFRARRQLNPRVPATIVDEYSRGWKFWVGQRRENAAGSLLASEAVAMTDTSWLALHLNAQLSAGAAVREGIRTPRRNDH